MLENERLLEELINVGIDIIRILKITQEQGILMLERAIDDIDYDIMKVGLGMAIDGFKFEEAVQGLNAIINKRSNEDIMTKSIDELYMRGLYCIYDGFTIKKTISYLGYGIDLIYNLPDNATNKFTKELENRYIKRNEISEMNRAYMKSAIKDYITKTEGVAVHQRDTICEIPIDVLRLWYTTLDEI